MFCVLFPCSVLCYLRRALDSANSRLGREILQRRPLRTTSFVLLSIPALEAHRWNVKQWGFSNCILVNVCVSQRCSPPWHRERWYEGNLKKKMDNYSTICTDGYFCVSIFCPCSVLCCQLPKSGDRSNFNTHKTCWKCSYNNERPTGQKQPTIRWKDGGK